MPVTGRKPKPQGQARHRVQPVHEWTEVERVPFAEGPDLPERRANGRVWPDEVKATWDAWRAMPHCKLWGPSDWRFALATIDLAALVQDGEPKYATEVRNRERVLGTTLDFRRDLRIRYIDPKPEAESAAGVTNIADYRDF